MLDLPHPLLADDINLLVGRRRFVEPNVNLRSPDEQDEENPQRCRGPQDLEPPGSCCEVGPRVGGGFPIADAESQHHGYDRRHDHATKTELREIEIVDHHRVDGGRIGPEWYPMIHGFTRSVRVGWPRRSRGPPRRRRYWRR